MVKDRLSAEQAAAIERFCREKRAIPMLSIFPNQVNFRMKDTDEPFTTTLNQLVYDHQVGKAEEQKTRAEEKKRIERDNKWKPIVR